MRNLFHNWNFHLKLKSSKSGQCIAMMCANYYRNWKYFGKFFLSIFIIIFEVSFLLFHCYTLVVVAVIVAVVTPPLPSLLFLFLSLVLPQNEICICDKYRSISNWRSFTRTAAFFLFFFSSNRLTILYEMRRMNWDNTIGRYSVIFFPFWKSR